jgi:hypothetical protein
VAVNVLFRITSLSTISLLQVGHIITSF